MARYSRRNGMNVLGEAKKVNRIERDIDNTSEGAKEELKVRSRKRKAASDQSVPGQVVTSPPTSETPVGG